MTFLHSNHISSETSKSYELTAHQASEGMAPGPRKILSRTIRPPVATRTFTSIGYRVRIEEWKNVQRGTFYFLLSGQMQDKIDHSGDHWVIISPCDTHRLGLEYGLRESPFYCKELILGPNFRKFRTFDPGNNPPRQLAITLAQLRMVKLSRWATCPGTCRVAGLSLSQLLMLCSSHYTTQTSQLVLFSANRNRSLFFKYDNVYW